MGFLLPLSPLRGPRSDRSYGTDHKEVAAPDAGGVESLHVCDEILLTGCRRRSFPSDVLQRHEAQVRWEGHIRRCLA